MNRKNIERFCQFYELKTWVDAVFFFGETTNIFYVRQDFREVVIAFLKENQGLDI